MSPDDGDCILRYGAEPIFGDILFRRKLYNSFLWSVDAVNILTDVLAWKDVLYSVE